MSKHTPGPWVADLYDGGGFTIRPHGYDIPVIADRNECPQLKEEMLANARLIAAAPEMSDKIKAALREWDILPQSLPVRIEDVTEWLIRYMGPCMEDLRAIITKAGG